MRRPLALLVPVLLVLLAPGRASARIAVEPLREVLRRANPDLRDCARTHRLADGRYAVRLVLDLTTGKIDHVDVTDAPTQLSPADASCIEAAFTHLAFPAMGPVDPREPGMITDGQRRARVPAPPYRGPSNRSGVAVIMWPFILGAPTPAAGMGRAGTTTGTTPEASSSVSS